MTNLFHGRFVAVRQIACTELTEPERFKLDSVPGGRPPFSTFPDWKSAGRRHVILDGESVATVYYWLTVVPVSGPVIAEGSISGSEDVMRKIKKATAAQLVLLDGPTFSLQCHGGRSGVRWVKALRP